MINRNQNQHPKPMPVPPNGSNQAPMDGSTGLPPMAGPSEQHINDMLAQDSMSNGNVRDEVADVLMHAQNREKRSGSVPDAISTLNNLLEEDTMPSHNTERMANMENQLRSLEGKINRNKLFNVATLFIVSLALYFQFGDSSKVSIEQHLSELVTVNELHVSAATAPLAPAADLNAAPVAEETSAMEAPANNVPITEPSIATPTATEAAEATAMVTAIADDMVTPTVTTDSTGMMDPMVATSPEPDPLYPSTMEMVSPADNMPTADMPQYAMTSEMQAARDHDMNYVMPMFVSISSIDTTGYVLPADFDAAASQYPVVHNLVSASDLIH